MLKFVWKATHAGAPDTDDYAEASDGLFLRDGSGNDTELQRFGKAERGWQDAEAPMLDAVEDWKRQRGDGRAVILVHGYDHDPDDPEKAVFDDNPYNGVYRDANDGVSWIPIFGRDNAVCFAWTSKPSLTEAGRACWTNTYEYAVQDVSVLAAKALSAIIFALREKGITVDLFAHSLGTRVVSKALARLRDKAQRPDAVRRAIMLGGAEYSLDALGDMNGTGAAIYNFVARRDGVLKWGASQLGGKQRIPNTIASRVIGRDGMKRVPNWIDFQLDHGDEDNAEEFRAWFDDLGGYKLSGQPTGGRGVHWCYYMHRDNRLLYRDILDNEILSIDWMRDQAAPDGVDRFRYQELGGASPETPMTCRDRHALYGRGR